MSRSVEAIVEPRLLIWARDSAGLDVATAASKVQARPDLLESWERGEARPTIRQLRELGRVYKRPIAVFYLPEPPTDFQALRDFRRLYGVATIGQSPQLRFELRRAHSRREFALELYELMEGSPPDFGFNVTLSDDPETAATGIRRRLHIRYEDQVRWSSPHDAFNRWRAALEAAGVMVFQALDVDLQEMRGFSIHSSRLPAIALNIKDSARGRIFTMLHELAHIGLKEGGLCDLDENSPRYPDDQTVEVFCNHIAGASLVPRECLLEEKLVVSKRGDLTWSDQEITVLANRYGCSREVLLRRLLICGRTSDAFYQEKRRQLQEEYEGIEERKEEGFAPPHRLALSSAGGLFTQLVLANYRQETITASDVADFLDVRLKHLGKIESELGRSAS